uniref:C2H2-type domain-containing protein n=1 Tax=Timema douglasi TaxID=61478 RepID=A0A7R8Z6W1_TIMDO|nr:unnamed protein product [Timema douglasi]
MYSNSVITFINALGSWLSHFAKLGTYFSKMATSGSARNVRSSKLKSGGDSGALPSNTTSHMMVTSKLVMGTYMCPLCCGGEFLSRDSLRDHLMCYTESLYCPECSKCFESVVRLVEHLETACDEAHTGHHDSTRVTRTQKQIYLRFNINYICCGHKMRTEKKGMAKKFTEMKYLGKTAREAKKEIRGADDRKCEIHPTEIRTSISPSSAVELNTTSALANYTTEAGNGCYERRKNDGRIYKGHVLLYSGAQELGGALLYTRTRLKGAKLILTGYTMSQLIKQLHTVRTTNKDVCFWFQGKILESQSTQTLDSTSVKMEGLLINQSQVKAEPNYNFSFSRIRSKIKGEETFLMDLGDYNEDDDEDDEDIPENNVYFPNNTSGDVIDISDNDADSSESDADSSEDDLSEGDLSEDADISEDDVDWRSEQVRPENNGSVESFAHPSPAPMFKCSVCPYEFTSVEEHIKLYHTQDEVELQVPKEVSKNLLRDGENVIKPISNNQASADETTDQKLLPDPNNDLEIPGDRQSGDVEMVGDHQNSPPELEKDNVQCEPQDHDQATIDHGQATIDHGTPPTSLGEIVSQLSLEPQIKNLVSECDIDRENPAVNLQGVTKETLVTPNNHSEQDAALRPISMPQKLSKPVKKINSHPKINVPSEKNNRSSIFSNCGDDVLVEHKLTGERLIMDPKGLTYVRKLIPCGEIYCTTKENKQTLPTAQTQPQPQEVEVKSKNKSIDDYPQTVTSFRDYTERRYFTETGKRLGSIYTCKVCNRECLTYPTFRHHSCTAIVYSCDVCNETFRRKKDLTKHLLSEHNLSNSSLKKKDRLKTKDVSKPPLTLVCEACGTVFNNKRSHLQHKKMHLPKIVDVEFNEDGSLADLNCKCCTFVAMNKKGLRTHMIVHAPYKKRRTEPTSEVSVQDPSTILTADNLTCHMCDQLFERTLDLHEHFKTHYYNKEDEKRELAKLNNITFERANMDNPEKASLTFTCEICHLTLDKSIRVSHILSHSGDVRFTCEICNGNFYTREQFNLHMRAHNGDTPYMCRICKKRFADMHLLEKHSESHRENRNYPCRFCSKRFQRPSGTLAHERIHTGERPFTCQHCGLKFRLRGMDARHAQSYSHRRQTLQL